MSTRGFENLTLADIDRWNAQRRTKGVMPSEAGQRAVDPVRSSAIAGGDASPQTNHTSKYRNKVCYVGSERFDSKHEAECWLTLQLLEREQQIFQLRRQVPIELLCPILIEDDPGRDKLYVKVCEYVCDFEWRDREYRRHIGDAKSAGTRTQLYLLKRKWLALQIGVEIEEL